MSADVARRILDLEAEGRGMREDIARLERRIAALEAKRPKPQQEKQ